MSEAMTVLEVLRAAGGWLSQQGIESPRLNAEHLLAKILDCRRLDLYLRFDRPVSEGERSALRELVRRRASGLPLQHLLGEWDFFGRTFRVDRRALVPRPETELLVARMLEVLPADEPLRVADAGTGSGVIALTLAAERPAWRLTATDSSPDALALASENRSLHGLDERVELWLGDLLPPDRRFQSIAANLPYIPTGDLDALPAEVRHDPVPALDGGADGLGPIRRLAETAAARLEPGGVLFLEFGAGQETAVRNLLDSRGYCGIQFHTDQQGFPRIAETRR